MVLKAYKTEIIVNNKQETLLLQHIGCVQVLEQCQQYSLERLGDFLAYLCIEKTFPPHIHYSLGENAACMLKYVEGLSNESPLWVSSTKRRDRMVKAVEEWITQLRSTQFRQTCEGYHLRVPSNHEDSSWWRRKWKTCRMIDEYSALALYETQIMPSTNYQFPERFREEVYTLNNVRKSSFRGIADIFEDMLIRKDTHPLCPVYFDGSIVGEDCETSHHVEREFANV